MSRSIVVDGGGYSRVAYGNAAWGGGNWQHPGGGVSHGGFGGGVGAGSSQQGAMLRAMTKNHRTLDNAMMMSSVMPSEKHSCSGSPLMFWNGNIAIDGLSRNGSGAFGGVFSAIGMR
jgi:hypothetical protein